MQADERDDDRRVTMGPEGARRVEVQIFGNTYTIRGEADREYVLGVAAYVDRKMREITEKLPVASVAKVAVLASLNIADELFKERAQRTRSDRNLGDRAARLEAFLDEVIQEGAGEPEPRGRKPRS